MGKDIAKKFEGKWIQDKAENMDAVSLKNNFNTFIVIFTYHIFAKLISLLLVNFKL